MEDGAGPLIDLKSHLPMQPEQAQEVVHAILRCLDESPDKGEGVVMLGRGEHAFIYKAFGDEIRALVAPRDVAETVLHEARLSADAEWTFLSDTERSRPRFQVV